MISCLPAVLALLCTQPASFARLDPSATGGLPGAKFASRSDDLEPKTVEDVLAKVRAAVHYDEWSQGGKALLLTGVERLQGQDTQFTLQFDSMGRWIERDAPPLAWTSAFDAERYWIADSTGATIAESMGFATGDRYVHLLLTDAWLGAAADVAATFSPGRPKRDEYEINIKLRATDAPARVIVARGTFLPIRATVPGPYGNLEMRFVAWKTVEGLSLPATAETDSPSGTCLITVASGAAATKNSVDTYRMPAWLPNDTTFDASAPTAVETKRSKGGHLLVHPRVNGQDVGWFVFDTGASGMFIDNEIARKLNLRKLALLRVTGVAGKASAWRCRVDTFTLGPLTIRDLPFDTGDWGAISKAFGVPVGGIVGYDMLRRAVISVPASHGDVEIQAPIRGPMPGRALQLDGRVPLVYLECERGAGWFLVDTGSDFPVTFFPHFVDKTRLLDDRAVESGKAAGIGGNFAAKYGPMGWVRFGGNRLKQPWATFLSSRTGVSASAFVAGSIGQATLQLFDVTFDYGGAGVTFKPAGDATLFGDDGPGRKFGSLDTGWIRLVTEKTFYERFLNPGESVSIDVLAPDDFTGIEYTADIHDKFEPLGDSKGTRVTFSRDARAKSSK